MRPVLFACALAAGGGEVTSDPKPPAPRLVSEDAVEAAAREPKREPTVQALVKRLSADEKTTRDEAVEKLARLDTQEVWKAVKPKLGDDAPETRHAVMRLVREKRIDRAVGTVSRTLRHDKDRKVRREAAHALAELAPERAVGELRTAAFMDREAIVRRAAIQDLGRIGSIEAARALYDLLEEALEDEDEYFAGLTLRALTLATGKSLGDNLEGWRHWIERQETRDDDVFDIVDDS